MDHIHIKTPWRFLAASTNSEDWDNLCNFDDEAINQCWTSDHPLCYEGVDEERKKSLNSDSKLDRKWSPTLTVGVPLALLIVLNLNVTNVHCIFLQLEPLWPGAKARHIICTIIPGISRYSFLLIKRLLSCSMCNPPCYGFILWYRLTVTCRMSMRVQVYVAYLAVEFETTCLT